LSAETPRITFGIIVLNGEPFTRYNLKSLYPFAHEIIVVEGACSAAAGIAGTDGHSTDGTLETLKKFKAHEDPEDKLIIVTAEDEGYSDGFWPGEKDEQSQAYAKRATGNYLWQVDIDEFYKPDDMATVCEILRDCPDITAVSFKMVTFWGGLDYIVDGWYLRRGAEIYHRLFKWGKDYRYTTHRPPTITDAEGQNLRSLKWLTGQNLAKQGIFLYHYSLLFPKCTMEKCDYYGHADWVQANKAKLWADQNYMQLKKPFRVHNVYQYPSWLERFYGEHPPQVYQLWQDIKQGKIYIKLRKTRDIERLLSSLLYRFSRTIVREFDAVNKWWYTQEKRIRSWLS